MALETLKNVERIGEFVVHHWPKDMHIEAALNRYYIRINHDTNEITFKLQNGPIKECGVNGCQVDTITETAKIIVEEFNKRFPCRENAMQITKLDEALLWSIKRQIDRIERGVEGHLEK